MRQLLIFFYDKKGPEPVQVPVIPGFDELAIKYHLTLLHQAGFLTCEPVRSSTRDRVIYVLPFDLTWDGHEFLAKITNQYVWDEVMADVKRAGFMSTSISILKQLLDTTIKKRLGLT